MSTLVVMLRACVRATLLKRQSLLTQFMPLVSFLYPPPKAKGCFSYIFMGFRERPR